MMLVFMTLPYKGIITLGRISRSVGFLRKPSVTLRDAERKGGDWLPPENSCIRKSWSIFSQGAM